MTTFNIDFILGLLAGATTVAILLVFVRGLREDTSLNVSNHYPPPPALQESPAENVTVTVPPMLLSVPKPTSTVSTRRDTVKPRSVNRGRKPTAKSSRTKVTKKTSASTKRVTRRSR